MKKILTIIFVCVLSFSAAELSHAANLYWGSGVTPGGAGTWTTVTTSQNWATSSGGSYTGTWTNSLGSTNTAIFEGTAGQINNSPITVNKIITQIAGYNFFGSGTANAISFQGADAGIEVNHTSLTTTISGNFNAPVAFTKSGVGRLEMNNSAQTCAKIILKGGFVSLAAPSRLGPAPGALKSDWLDFDGGGFSHATATGMDLGPNRGVTIRAGGAFFSASATANQTTITAPIVGTNGGALRVTGAAPFYSPYHAGCNLILSNTNNSWNGATFVTAGTLTLGAANVLPNTTTLTLNGGDLATGGFSESIGNLIVNSSASGISGAGTLTATNYDMRNSTTISTILGGAGVKLTKTTVNTVDLTAANTYTGGTFINAGTLRVNNNASLGAANSAVTMANDVTLATTAATARTLTYAYTINGNVTIGQAATGTGALTLAGSVNLGGSVRTLTIDNTTDTISGIITNGGLDKAGAGTLILTGANNYTGATTVSAGKLVTTTASGGGGSYTVADGAMFGVASAATTGSSLAMSDLTLGNSTMEFDFAHFGYPTTNVISVAGDLTVNGNITVDVKGFDTNGTATLIEYSGNRNGGGTFILNAVPPRVVASIFDDTVNKKVILTTTASDTLIWVSDFNGIWEPNNPGNVTWKLAGDETPTYYQENTVQGDTVRFDDTATTTTAVDIIVPVTPFQTTVNNSTSNYTFYSTFTGKISGDGNLVKTGSGELTISIVNDYTGGTTLSAGTINLATNTVFGTGKLTVNGNVVIRSDSSTGAPLRTLAVATEITNANLTLGDAANNGDLTFSGVVAGNGSVTKVGSGLLNFTGANTLTGGFAHNGGTVRVNANTGLGAVNSPVSLTDGVTLSTSAGTARTLTHNFSITGDITLGQITGGTAALTLAGSVNLGGSTRTITISNATDTISAAITNGGLVKIGSGALVLTGANSYNGGTTVNEGLLQGNTTSFQGNITNNSTVTITQTTAGTYAGNMSGTGTLTKAGTGAVTLSGNNTYSGATTISAGMLFVNGTLASSSVTVNAGATLGGNGTVHGSVTVSAGGNVGAGASAGLLTFTNGLSLTAGGTNVWELAANSTANPGTDFDQIVISGGDLALGGTARLALRFIGSSTSPTNTDSFWQSPRSWKIISLTGIAANPGSSDFLAITGTNNITAGVFTTAVDGSGSIFLNYTPSAPPPPVISPNIVGAGTTSAQISWSSVDGANYTVQYKTNLNQVGWLDLTNVVATGTSTTIVDNTDPVPNERYYQIIIP